MAVRFEREFIMWNYVYHMNPMNFELEVFVLLN